MLASRRLNALLADRRLAASEAKVKKVAQAGLRNATGFNALTVTSVALTTAYFRGPEAWQADFEIVAEDMDIAQVDVLAEDVRAVVADLEDPWSPTFANFVRAAEAEAAAEGVSLSVQACEVLSAPAVEVSFERLVPDPRQLPTSQRASGAPAASPVLPAIVAVGGLLLWRAS